MNIIKGLFVCTGRLKLRTKLLVSYILLLLIPISLISIMFYYSSLDVVSDLAAENAYQIIKSKNEILDTKLSKVQESSLAIIKDKELFELLNGMNEAKGNVLSMDRKISKVIDNYFGLLDYVYGVQIATSYYIFGNNFNMLTGESYVKSELYKETVRLDGKLNWVPTYNFVDMFGYLNMKDANFEVRNVFSASRLLNSFYLDNGVFSVLEDDVERPVLIINFKEDIIRDIFKDSIPIQGATFYMMDKDGNNISHSDQTKVGKNVRPVWLEQAIKNKTGTTTVKVDGQNRIICYDTSSVTDWIAVADIPTNELAGNIIPSIVLSIVSVSVIFLILALVLAFLISGMITKPISRLVVAMKSMGHGNFNVKIPIENKDELGYLIKKFNNMNDQIKTLIEENYTVKLREKETEIMALNLQLNPHFLYNTLNIINWMAIEEGNKGVSDMLINLCDMLVYTVRNKQDMVNFVDDLKWLQCYLFIMSIRFENKFIVQWDVDEALNHTQVPKLFLQPFVENAILHGFERIESGGIIKITGSIENEARYFRVCDNGKGMDTSKLTEDKEENNDSIGISNVDRRIKLLFGQKYGVSIVSSPENGMQVEIVLPL